MVAKNHDSKEIGRIAMSIRRRFPEASNTQVLMFARALDDHWNRTRKMSYKKPYTTKYIIGMLKTK